MLIQRIHREQENTRALVKTDNSDAGALRITRHRPNVGKWDKLVFINKKLLDERAGFLSADILILCPRGHRNLSRDMSANRFVPRRTPDSTFNKFFFGFWFLIFGLAWPESGGPIQKGICGWVGPSTVSRGATAEAPTCIALIKNASINGAFQRVWKGTHTKGIVHADV